MERYVLDSYAVLPYLNDEPAAQDVEDVLRLAVNGKVKVWRRLLNCCARAGRPLSLFYEKVWYNYLAIPFQHHLSICYRAVF